MFVTNAPEATAHKVELKGFALLLGATLKEKACMEMVLTAEYPLKKGGTRQKHTKQTLIFTYCPFCGRNYDEGGE
jgi:hypothetical protein